MKQNGNALIFILIAIALLGLLTVTLSRSGDSTNDTGDFEQNQIIASEILAYAKSIENAVQSLLARGCSENELSFENDVVAGYENPNSPADNSCHIFDTAGAGMTYQAPNEDWLDNNFSEKPDFNTNVFNGHLHITNKLDLNTNDVSKKELLIVTPYLKDSVCAQINTISNANIASANPPKEDNTTAINFFVKYTGTFSVGADIDANGSDLDLNVFRDVLSGCTRPSDENSNMMFHTLISR